MKLTSQICSLTQRRVLPARNDDRQIALTGGDEPAVPGIDLVVLLEFPRTQYLV